MPWADRLQSSGWEEMLVVLWSSCQCDADCVCVCVFTHSDSWWVPSCCSDRLPLPLPSLTAAVTPPLYLCHFSLVFFFPCSCCLSFFLPSFLLCPLPLFPLLLIALPLSLNLVCFLSEWYRRSALRPHSSLWQPQLPDNRKQIPQQEPDINGLSCFFSSCDFSLFFPPHLSFFIKYLL